MLTHANQFVHAISHYWSHYTGLFRNAGHNAMVSLYHDFINNIHLSILLSLHAVNVPCPCSTKFRIIQRSDSFNMHAGQHLLQGYNVRMATTSSLAT